MRSAWALAFVVLAGCAGPAQPLPDLGPAPTYSVTLLDGDDVALDDLQGQVVVVNLWATWCTPCKHELPLLQELEDQRGDEGLQVLAIAMDDGPDALEDVRAYTNKAGLRFAVGHDAGGDDFVPAFYPLGSLGAPPETFLIGKDGHVIHVWNGAFDPQDPENVDMLDRALAA